MNGQVPRVYNAGHLTFLSKVIQAFLNDGSIIRYLTWFRRLTKTNTISHIGSDIINGSIVYPHFRSFDLVQLINPAI
jgi:hypothetical protein